MCVPSHAKPVKCHMSSQWDRQILDRWTSSRHPVDDCPRRWLPSLHLTTWSESRRPIQCWNYAPRVTKIVIKYRSAYTKIWRVTLKCKLCRSIPYKNCCYIYLQGLIHWRVFECSLQSLNIVASVKVSRKVIEMFEEKKPSMGGQGAKDPHHHALYKQYCL